MMRRTAGWLAAALVLAACSDTRTGGNSVEAGPACGDGVDNDGDGWTDCADQDCWGDAACGDATSDAGSDATTPDAGADAGSDVAGPPDITSDLPQPDAEPSGTCEPCGYGEIIGQVCAPNEQIFVNGATVSVTAVDCDGKQVTVTAKSGANGVYHLTGVPCGKHIIDIDKGSFHTDYGFDVEAGEVHDVTGAASKLCFKASSATIAVLDGSWDDIEGLVGQLGFDFDLYTIEGTEPAAAGAIVELLGDPLAMSQYDIIFANCGAYNGWMPQDFPAVMPNVKQFVLDGGSLYMSDYAWVYGEWSFPDAIEFRGDDDPMNMYKPGSPQQIQGDQTVTGQILDGNLASWLGKTSLAITFDQGPQIAPEAPGPGTFVHVQAEFDQWLADPPVTGNVPLALSYKPAPDAGRVIYTNFHNDAQTSGDMLKIIQYLVFEL